MKQIKKRQQPQKFIEWVHGNWKDQDGRPKTPRYDDDMTGEVHEALLVSLVQEQGYLCCYTGCAITDKTSHVEHIYPRTLSKKNGTHEDIDYQNMLAAYPQPNLPQDCPYGARARGSWYNSTLFVHPLRENCEQRFHYRDNGKVEPTNAEDQGASETICNLNLNHPELVKWRRRAIYEAIFRLELTKAQVERLVAEMDRRDSDGRFRAFCFVIKQVGEKHLKRFN